AAYKLTSTYTPAGQLQSQHLNSLVYDRDYGWNDNGDLYDPLGRRMAKRVWRRERDLTGWMSLSRKPEMTWYG
ncbi:hypothetical protein, partial [Escherichia coli]|uniref:hypothetical protein n=1 Tax=Escherichia coli TaxID=562 RepID=UPI00164F5767